MHNKYFYRDLHNAISVNTISRIMEQFEEFENNKQRRISKLTEKIEIEQQKMLLILMNEPDHEYDDKLNEYIKKCKFLTSLLCYAYGDKYQNY
jgi:hypothetical protein